MAGKSADNIGNQCGGWTIDWQGKRGDVTTGGTTVLAAIKGAASQGHTGDVLEGRHGGGGRGRGVR